MEPIIRIKTQVDKDRVLTIWDNGKWVTIANIGGKSLSAEATNLFQAGQNHLSFCKLFKRNNEQHKGT